MSFETVVTGIRAASFQLGVIGNNIANASTVGFKESRAGFAGIIQQSLLGTGTGPEAGVAITGTTTAFSQGGIKRTENPLDVAINGNGLFTVIDGSGNRLYSRAGDFVMDPEGFITNKSGFKLQGYLAGADGNIGNQIGSLRIRDVAGAPQQTTRVNLGANLDSRQEEPGVAWAMPPTPEMYNATTSIRVFDSLGEQHEFNVYFRKTAVVNSWEAYVTIGDNQIGGAIPIAFGTDGLPNPALLPIPLNWTPAGASPATTELRLSPLTQFSGRFAVTELTQDGFSTGSLTGLRINEIGVVEAQLSNGQTESIGQIAIAKFRNNLALQPAGGNLWAATLSSGPAQIGVSGLDGFGRIESGALEESNVDITEQLVDMITAQRNFQASVKALQTQDAITQSVLNIR
jgi:flagellar hook protein FlgE